jgi:hypothetical protein
MSGRVSVHVLFAVTCEIYRGRVSWLIFKHIHLIAVLSAAKETGILVPPQTIIKYFGKMHRKEICDAERERRRIRIWAREISWIWNLSSVYLLLLGQE